MGRSAVSGNEVNHFTYPYLHDGAANTLTEAVDIMGRLPLSRKFNDDENAKKVSVHADKQLTRLLRKTPHGTNATASLWTASRACASRKDAASNHPESTAHTGVTGNPEQ